MLNSVSEAVFNYYGNPSSIHRCGSESRDQIENARQQVASALGAKPTEIIFTSGGTEANNIALADVNARFAKIISAVEHSSIFNLTRSLPKGSATSVARVNKDGTLNLEDLKSILSTVKAEGFIVSVMLANNETGVILDPEGDLLKLKEEYGFLLHLDAVQGFGKLPINLSDLNVDMLSVSAHKLHGLKGAGALFVRERLQRQSYPDPLFLGGSHESNFRPGTENLMGILSLGYMAEKMSSDRHYKGRLGDIKAKRDWFETELADISQINGSKENRIDNTSNLYFPEISELNLFLEILSERNLCVSGQSACSSGLAEPSRVLTEMFGVESPVPKGSIRFSLSVDTTQEEMVEAVSIIREAIGFYKEVKEVMK